VILAHNELASCRVGESEGLRCVVVVLVHGFLGWGDDAKRPGMRRSYFNGVREFYEKEYHEAQAPWTLRVVAPTLPACESVTNRAAILQGHIMKTLASLPANTRVHVVAHSQGGLDARWMIAQGGMVPHIASLTMIATPNGGTILADLAYLCRHVILLLAKATVYVWNALERTPRSVADGEPSNGYPWEFLRRLLEGVNVPLTVFTRGVYDLTQSGAIALNNALAESERKVPKNGAGTYYFSYAGDIDQPTRHPFQNMLLKPASLILRWASRRRGESLVNDGAVSLGSSRFPWRQEIDRERIIPFNHFLQLNWRFPDFRRIPDMDDDLKTMYRDIMNNIVGTERLLEK
jgi:pimeloyl-ACP methyl ester carboxylesterase